MTVNVVGQRFGDLLVLWNHSKRTKRGYMQVECLCLKCKQKTTICRFQLTRSLNPQRQCSDCMNKAKITKRAEKYLNKKFHMLTVRKYAGIINGYPQWYCDCDCGTKGYRIIQNNLNKTKSCGCLIRGYNIGDRFGRLVITEILKKKKGHCAYVLCDCDCGTKAYKIYSRALKVKTNKHEKSCGCSHNKYLKSYGRNQRDLSGKKFGKWLVLRKCSPRYHECKCGICSTIKKVHTKTLLDGHSKTCRNCSHHVRRKKFEKKMIGKKFGKLTVVGRSSRIAKNGSRYWYFDCDCGTRNYETMLRNRLTSCGCTANIKDLTGQRFGNLTVISLHPVRRRKQAQWNCLCDCGKSKIRIASYLRLKTITPSCGCLGNKNRIKDFTGQRFGKLTVLKLSKNRTKNNMYKWVCKCDCGTIKEVGRGNFGNTYSCGCMSKDYIDIMKSKRGFSRKELTARIHKKAKGNRQQAKLGNRYNLDWEESGRITNTTKTINF